MLFFEGSVPFPECNGLTGVALDTSNGRVAATGAFNHTVAVRDTNANSPLGAAVAVLGGLGSDPTQEGLALPLSAAFDGQGHLYVLDSANGELDRYLLQSGAYVYDSAFLGGDRGTLAGRALLYPSDLAVEGGDLFVLDGGNRRVVKLTITSGQSSEEVVDPGLDQPTAFALGPGTIYVADAGRHEVAVYDRAGTKQRTVGGYGTAAGRLRSPEGVAVDGQGHLVVADGGNGRLQTFDASGDLLSEAPLPGLGARRIRAASGKVYVADAVQDAVHVFGDGRAGPSPVLDRTSLDFGAVEEGLTLTLAVYVRNEGAAPLEVRHIRTDDPAFKPVTMSLRLDPGERGEVLVAFCPALPGTYYTGTLTAEAPGAPGGVLRVSLSGNGQPAEPVDVVLVLDRSGSMSDPAGPQTKWELLREATSLFVSLSRSDRGDRIGVVTYADGARVDVPLAPTSGQGGAARVDQALARIQPRGRTALGAGVRAAMGLLPSSSERRQVVVVVSDGKENEPPYIVPPRSTDPTVALAEYDRADVYCVGLGEGTQVDLRALSKLSAPPTAQDPRRHVHVTGDDWLRLQKFFVEAFADADGQYVALDPAHEVVGGRPTEIEVPLAGLDREATFVVFWGDPSARLSVSLETPSGVELEPRGVARTGAVDYKQGRTYALYRVPLPLGGPFAGDHGGIWRLRVRNDSPPGAEEPSGEARVPFEVEVIVRSDLGIACTLGLSGDHTGQTATLHAGLTMGGRFVEAAERARLFLTEPSTDPGAEDGGSGRELEGLSRGLFVSEPLPFRARGRLRPPYGSRGRARGGSRATGVPPRVRARRLPRRRSERVGGRATRDGPQESPRAP